jgi:hypothetical protein
VCPSTRFFGVTGGLVSESRISKKAVGEDAVIQLGRMIGLSRLKSIEFYRHAKRQCMRCLLCGHEDVKGRHFTLDSEGITVYGICTPCNSEGYVNERIKAHVEKYGKGEAKKID